MALWENITPLFEIRTFHYDHRDLCNCKESYEHYPNPWKLKNCKTSNHPIKNPRMTCSLKRISVIGNPIVTKPHDSIFDVKIWNEIETHHSERDHVFDDVDPDVNMAVCNTLDATDDFYRLEHLTRLGEEYCEERGWFIYRDQIADKTYDMFKDEMIITKPRNGFQAPSRALHYVNAFHEIIRNMSKKPEVRIPKENALVKRKLKKE